MVHGKNTRFPLCFISVVLTFCIFQRSQTLAQFSQTVCNRFGNSFALHSSQSSFLSSRNIPTTASSTALGNPSDPSSPPYYTTPAPSVRVSSRIVVTLTQSGISASQLVTALSEAAVVSASRFNVISISGTLVQYKQQHKLISFCTLMDFYCIGNCRHHCRRSWFSCFFSDSAWSRSNECRSMGGFWSTC